MTDCDLITIMLIVLGLRINVIYNLQAFNSRRQRQQLPYLGKEIGCAVVVL